MQPSHSRVTAMASAMSSFVLADSAPSAMAAELRALYADITSGMASFSAR